MRRALRYTEDELAAGRAASEEAEREREAAVKARDVFRQQMSSLEDKMKQQKEDYEAKIK